MECNHRLLVKQLLMLVMHNVDSMHANMSTIPIIINEVLLVPNPDINSALFGKTDALMTQPCVFTY